VQKEKQGLGHDAYRGKGEERSAAKAMAIDGHGGSAALIAIKGMRSTWSNGQNLRRGSEWWLHRALMTLIGGGEAEGR
jgi:hypothetical protein